jgi:Mce-associated membrane protein
VSTPNGPRRPGNGPARRRRIAGESSRASDAAAVAPPTPPRPAPRQAPEPVEPQDVETHAHETEAEHAAPEDTAPQDTAPAAPPAPRVGRSRATETGPVEENAEHGTARSRRIPSWPALLASLAVTFALIGAGYGVLQWRAGSDVEAAHRDAAEAAAGAAETIFTYRYDRLDAYLEDAKATMTPQFADDFESISPALGDLAPQRQIQVQAGTRDAAALPCGDDCSSDRARVLVFVDQARVADGEATPTVFGNRVEFEMVRTDGRWLVDDITAL